jgi:hypothetical protein
MASPTLNSIMHITHLNNYHQSISLRFQAAVLWNRSDLLRFRFQFSNNKNLYKILPFQCQKQNYCPESGLSLVIFDFFITFYVGSGTVMHSVPFPLRQKVTVSAVQVPVPQHCKEVSCIKDELKL